MNIEEETKNNKKGNYLKTIGWLGLIAISPVVLFCIYYIGILTIYYFESRPYKPDLSYEDRSWSLKGIDSNNNGVRDDIEKYIEETWSGEEPIISKAVMNYAKHSNKIFDVNLSKSEEIKQFNEKSDILYRCQSKFSNYLSDKYDSIRVGYLNYDAIFTLMTNTWLREFFYMRVENYVVSSESRTLQNGFNMFKDCELEVSKDQAHDYLFRMTLRECGLNCYQAKTKEKYEKKIGDKDEIELYEYYKEHIKNIDPSDNRLKK